MLTKPVYIRGAKHSWSLVCYAALGLWAFFALPTIALSGIFPMDMHFYYAINANFGAWLPWILWPETWSGRYFPVYWLFYATEFALFGSSVAGYLAVQSAVLTISAGVAAYLIVKTTKSFLLATVMIVLFYFNTPISENISTVGKSEPLACSLILVALAVFYRGILDNKRDDKKNGAAWSLFASGFLVLLAVWTKETSIVALGVPLTGLVLSSIVAILTKRADIRAQAGSYVSLTCTLLLALVLSQAHYLHEGVPPPGSASSTAANAHYVTFHMTVSLVLDNIRWYIVQQPDVFAFAIAALAFLFVVGRKIWLQRRQVEASSIRDYVFMFSLYSVAAVYYCAMWFWRWPMGYYMLMPSILFKACFLYGTYAAGIWDESRRLARRAVVALIGVGVAYAAVYCFYIISSQVAFSRVYTAALSRVLQMPGHDKTLIIESYPYFAEQVDATQVLFRYLTQRRGDGQHVEVKGIMDTLDPYVTDLDRPGNAEMMRMLGVTKEKLAENFENLPRKNDFLLTFTGGELATWFLRGVSPYYNEESQLRMQGAYDMQLIADKRETIPGVYLNLWSGRLVCERRWLGYKLYQVTGDQPKFLWRGRYPDGWTEGVSSLTVTPSYDRAVVIKFSAPKERLPLKMTIKRDGTFFKEFDLSSTDEQTLTLADKVNQPVTFEFSLDHTARPEMLAASQDARPTGVLLRLDSMPPPSPPTGVVSCFSH